MGSIYDGVLRKTLECHCRECGAANLGLSGHQPDAKAALWREGWQTRHGLWVCPTCAEKLPRGHRWTFTDKARTPVSVGKGGQ